LPVYLHVALQPQSISSILHLKTTNMIRKYLIFIAFLHFGINSFSQSARNMVDILNVKNELLTVNNKIVDLLMKDSYFSKTTEVQLFHIIWFEYHGEFRKEDFLNHSFLNKLNPCYYTKKSLFGKKEYLETQVLISDKLGNLIADSDGRAIYSAVKNNSHYAKYDIELLQMFYKNELDFVFYITNTPLTINFGIKGNDVYILKRSSEGLKIYSLDDYINFCWNTLYEK